jgi:hypothetical protein
MHESHVVGDAVILKPGDPRVAGEEGLTDGAYVRGGLLGVPERYAPVVDAWRVYPEMPLSNALGGLLGSVDDGARVRVAAKAVSGPAVVRAVCWSWHGRRIWRPANRRRQSGSFVSVVEAPQVAHTAGGSSIPSLPGLARGKGLDQIRAKRSLTPRGEFNPAGRSTAAYKAASHCTSDGTPTAAVMLVR